MRKTSVSSLAGLVALLAVASAEYCPSPEDLKLHGPPEGFVHADPNTSADDYPRVTDFDTAILDQATAEIENDKTATSNSVLCRYGTNILNERAAYVRYRFTF